MKLGKSLFYAGIATSVALIVASSFAGCGSDDGGNKDGGNPDGTIGDSDNPFADASNDGNTMNPFGDGGQCLKLGSGCANSSDCCSGLCNNNVCSFPNCTSDNQACQGNNDCCSKSCVAGKCVPLNNQCKTLGNKCMQNSECCSKLCSNGACAPSSFCGQPGDICAGNTDCCTGNCVKAMNQQFGICSPDPPQGPANCGLVDGVVCGGVVDGGADGSVPPCGGACCSRACGPWGPTKVMVCQPVSGCHVVGDLCTKDTDCCGALGILGGSNKPVTCEINPPYPVGICRNPMGCKPNGDVCKLKTSSCNSSCDCCAGNCQTQDTCHQDNVGVPRCSGPCVDGGVINNNCASSADCCGKPCVPNPKFNPDGGTPDASPYTCSPQPCQTCNQPCSNTADCCVGMSCINGTCGPCQPDGGIVNDSGMPPCAQYGQLCTMNGDCCNGVPCTNGHCYYPIN